MGIKQIRIDTYLNQQCWRTGFEIMTKRDWVIEALRRGFVPQKEPIFYTPAELIEKFHDRPFKWQIENKDYLKKKQVKKHEYFMHYKDRDFAISKIEYDFAGKIETDRLFTGKYPD